MEQEFDSTKHENKVDDSREGYQRPSYTKEYSSEGRPQRQRIRTPIRSAYPSDRQRYNSDREAGSFRPEGFGGGLAADGDHRQQYPQRPRYNNNYGERQQGYRPRYNNDGEGSDTSSRVAWSKQLTKKEAKQITIEEVFSRQDTWNGN